MKYLALVLLITPAYGQSLNGLMQMNDVNMRGIDQPMYSCTCATNAADGYQYNQYYNVDSMADLAETCPSLENKAFAISANGNTVGYASTLICNPRVISRTATGARIVNGPTPQPMSNADLSEQVQNLRRQLRQVSSQPQQSNGSSTPPPATPPPAPKRTGNIDREGRLPDGSYAPGRHPGGREP